MTMDRRINKSKSALRDALILLMENSSFEKITITEIVQHANLNRGTFYRHYQTKEELLEDMIDDVMNDLIHSYRSPYLNTDKFFVQELTSPKIKIFEHVYSYSKFYSAIVSSNAIPGFQQKICDTLKQLSRQDLGLSNIESHVDINFLTSYYAYAIFGLIMEWIQGGFKYTPVFMAEQLIGILSHQSYQAVYLKDQTKE
ncbi:TetR/AcrR family transcriptional regulator [Radiobacillus kanasensis]|uniref:TetR/AcrR family transcriptional regulator n=1 Tax=Radiobacillus kanasensis TaxID=2844358 RepID=UPI001E2B280D|nr:TetR/AcrR family transcriptional regulator [Radiobacillus kanasensis]UFT99884.1 TetR/AcrR family transcriptional regulator [Radiobacillus kanasensis]